MSIEAARRHYEATAYRDGKWWTFEIPELNGPSPHGATVVAMGQARTVAELDRAAREVAALWLGLDEGEIDVNVSVTPPAEVARIWAASALREEEGREAIKEAARLKRQAVQVLKAHGITQRDTARILGISAQRVNQLTHP